MIQRWVIKASAACFLKNDGWIEGVCARIQGGIEAETMSEPLRSQGLEVNLLNKDELYEIHLATLDVLACMHKLGSINLRKKPKI